MRTVVAMGLAITTMAAATTLPRRADAAAPAPAALSEAECEVWSRERSFARTVEAHDAAAFAAHLAEGSVFGAGGPAPVRGRDAVVADWQPIIDGKLFALRWHPQFVAIAPFSAGTTPFTKGETPFAEGNSPFGEGIAPFGEGNATSREGGVPIQKGNDPFGKGHLSNPIRTGKGTGSPRRLQTGCAVN